MSFVLGQHRVFLCLLGFVMAPVFAHAESLKIFRPGFAYAKSGIMLMNLISEERREMTLFDDPVQLGRSDALMNVMDRINRNFGKGAIRLLGEGAEQRWKMRTGNKSPNYTTRISDLVVAKA